MGFFSWKTMDTDKSIPNIYSSKGSFRVIMTDNNNKKWVENSYEGYGVFGGKDYYELFDEMNGGIGNREKGIEKAFLNNTDGNNPNMIYPSLSIDGIYREGKSPDICEVQGYFYNWVEVEE